MPSLNNHQSSVITKLILIGDSGSGKSGALASLANDGYNLRILDLDNGLDTLANVLKDPKGGYKPEALARVAYLTITDPMKNVGGKLIPRQAKAWQKAVEMLDNWDDGENKLGPISSWGERDIIVIDSLTFISIAAVNFVLAMNGRIGQQPHQSDWYQAQQLIEGLLAKLYDENIKCNVIVTSHITYIGEDNGPQRGYPASAGRALSPKIGRYFNSALMMRTSGSGTSVARKLITNSTPMVELKNSAPTRVKPEYPIQTGLAEYFRDVRGGTAAPAPSPVTTPSSPPATGSTPPAAAS